MVPEHVLLAICRKGRVVCFEVVSAMPAWMFASLAVIGRCMDRKDFRDFRDYKMPPILVPRRAIRTRWQNQAYAAPRQQAALCHDVPMACVSSVRNRGRVRETAAPATETGKHTGSGNRKQKQ